MSKVKREKMNKNTIPSDFSMGLALMDLLPVILFGGTGFLLAGLLQYPLIFIIGISICVLSGVLKVLWKIIVVVRKKNVWWMFVQMRIAMPIGFVLMLLSIVLLREQIDWNTVFNTVFSFPYLIIFIVGIVLFLAMMVCAFTLDSSKKRSNLIEQSINTLMQLAFFVAVLCIVMLGSSKPSEPLKPDDSNHIVETAEETITEESISRTTAEETTCDMTTASIIETSQTVDEKSNNDETNSSDPSDSFQKTRKMLLETDLTEFEKNVGEQKTLPCIRVTTPNGIEILDKTEYIFSRIDVFNCDEENQLTAIGGVKVRGNSTAEGKEKPYRIKFEEKQNMLGLHEGRAYKSWVLLKSYWNLAPDLVGFKLFDALCDGAYYSSDCTYVNVYVNDSYKGVYLLCEQNQAAKGRIDVNEPSKDEKNVDTGYLLEMDNNADSSEHPFFYLNYDGQSLTDINGETRKLCEDDYSIRSDVTCDAQIDFIHRYIQGVYDITRAAIVDNKILRFDEEYNVVDGTDVFQSGEEAVKNIMDTQSLIYMMFVQEMAHNYDVGAGSFYMAVDFTDKSKYEKLTFLAPWDFNWAYYEDNKEYYACTFQKLQDDKYDRSNYWYILLMKADWFQKDVKSLWKQIREDEIIEKTMDELRVVIDTTRNDLGDEAWRADCGYQITDFVLGRAKWLDKQWLKKKDSKKSSGVMSSEEK